VFRCAARVQMTPPKRKPGETSRKTVSDPLSKEPTPAPEDASDEVHEEEHDLT